MAHSKIEFIDLLPCLSEIARQFPDVFLKSSHIAFRRHQIPKASLDSEDPEGSSNDTNSHGGIAALHALHRFQINHHALCHRSSGHAPAFPRNRKILPQLLELINYQFG
jgi:hypothetical protein